MGTARPKGLACGWNAKASCLTRCCPPSLDVHSMFPRTQMGRKLLLLPGSHEHCMFGGARQPGHYTLNRYSRRTLVWVGPDILTHAEKLDVQVWAVLMSVLHARGLKVEIGNATSVAELDDDELPFASSRVTSGLRSGIERDSHTSVCTARL